MAKRKQTQPPAEEPAEGEEQQPKPKKRRRGHNEGSIYQRDSDGLWVASISLGVDPKTGKVKRKVLYGKTNKEVTAKLIKERAEHQAGINIAPQRQTVAQFLAFWLESVKGQVRPATYGKYEMHVRLRLEPSLGKHQLSKLSAQHVQAMVNKELSDGKVSPGTVADALTVLIIALNQAMRWDMVTRNVAQLVEKPRSPKRELNTLEPEEARHLLDTVRGDRLEALYVVSLSLGLRRGEALALRWEDVDLERGRLTVRRALQRVEHELRFVEPKSQSAYRNITLPAVTIATLHQHRARQEGEREKAGENWHEQGLVFTAMNARGHTGGGPIDPRNYKRSLDRMLKKAGLNPMRVHDLRHTCASLLLAQGVDIKMISEMLGHSRVGITLDRYSHLYESSRQETASRMDDVLQTRPEEGQTEEL